MSNSSQYSEFPNHSSPLERLEAKVLKDPWPSLIIAAGTGVLLKALPLGAILRGVIRLALVLCKPALLVFLGWQAAKRIKTGKT